MKEKEIRWSPVKSFYRFFSSITRDFRDWALVHRLQLFIVLFVIFAQLFMAGAFIRETFRRYEGTVGLNNGYWIGKKKYETAFGQGKHYNFANHLIYEGNMRFNKYHGFGTLFYVNGKKRFEGEWIMGMKKKGKFYSSSEELLYEGECVDDIYEGEGTVYENGIKRYSGNFKGGIRQNGYFYDDQGNILYHGSCIDNMYHGYGELYSNNTIVFAGYFVDGMKTGRGVSYYDDSRPSFIGLWEYNIMKYGLLFDMDGNIIIRGTIPSTILYIQHEQDIDLINETTEEVIIAYKTMSYPLELSHYQCLKNIFVMEGSCLNVTGFYVHDLPALESIYVYPRSFVLNESLDGDWGEDSSEFSNETPGESSIYSILFERMGVIIYNCPLLKTIHFSENTFVNHLFLNMTSTILCSLSNRSSFTHIPHYWKR